MLPYVPLTRCRGDYSAAATATSPADAAITAAPGTGRPARPEEGLSAGAPCMSAGERAGLSGG
ncbi:hypothetical protein Dvina_28590 [Dactylosporangium vinaceum]|uniref:Uncharacterized protein n=1 Tax=Dactylosporangium vinaceum TaxID=53362 RepID=A0ABV5MN34_9ACTN|nr:hypothetical protein [Dactylosporangium vinaceum]UAB92328.1 hypothetical protein Dvina_28590 [Dactylosporangium vinaceum]